METTTEKPTNAKHSPKLIKKPKPNEPHQVLSAGNIEIALWLSQTPTGITYPQFTLSRTFTSQSTGRQAASRYYDDTNEAELLEAIRQGVAATRALRERLAATRKAA
ncbi:MAG TPA: hypothetical protein VFE46_01665 [Pirellulales bacterium]|jgi:hypothetical protein|nr:hypothetical protein [Pirellulales bacterium]